MTNQRNHRIIPQRHPGRRSRGPQKVKQAYPPSMAQEQTTPICLSARGLERAASLEQSNFAIVVGSETFHCSKFQAAFISPKIAQLLQIDPTIEQFIIDDIEIESQNHRSLIEELLRIGNINVEKSQTAFVLQLCCQLKNDELSEEFSKRFLANKDIELTNCIERYRIKREMNIDYSCELEFIASHFHMIDKTSRDELRKTEVDKILQEASLELETEDWLVSYLIVRGSDFHELFRHVRFEHLSVSGIDEFLRHFSYSNVDEDIWVSLCRRLRHRIVNDSDDLSTSRSSLVLDISESSPWSGILSRLRTRAGGNVHLKNVVHITSSSDSYNKCYQVADHGWSTYWYTDNVSQSWIQFDFINSWISPTGYTLKSDGQGAHHLVQWKLEGSMDEREWKQIDNQNCQDLNGNYLTKTFRCASSDAGQFYRYIRLTQTGINSSNRNYLLLCNIEFYGMFHCPRTQ
jgi:hypothetical protein